jgi:hypothetical protein
MNVFGVGSGFPHGFEVQRVIGATLTLATVLFLMSAAPGFRYRRQVRIASIAIYCTLLAGVIVWVVLWLLGVAPGK